MKKILLPFLFVCILNSTQAIAVEISGKASLEATLYIEDGEFSQQDYRSNISIAIEPEFYWEWDNGDNSIVFTPFARIDEHDDERSHNDIRELSWTHIKEQWEFHTGIRKVFWGVTEFNHLVDIINQTDAVDSFDGEEKLGQLMFSFSRATDWGIIDGFILPGFRERTFSGVDGRLRSAFVTDTDRALYESSDEDKHIDFALRWSHSVDVFDIGIYWFDGTDRNPTFQVQTANGNTVLVPFYQQISQVGIDLQATIDSWLWKLESIYQDSHADRYLAAQAGFEYTFYGIKQSATDIGLLVEYGWDERGLNANRIAQNDIYVGARLTLNDSSDSALLMGISYDVDYHSRSLVIEASKRLNDRWTMALEGLFFHASDLRDPAATIDNDDRIQLTLERYF